MIYFAIFVVRVAASLSFVSQEKLRETRSWGFQVEKHFVGCWVSGVLFLTNFGTELLWCQSICLSLRD